MIAPGVDLGWTLEEVAAATSGTLHGASDTRITSVTTDSRDVPSGSLFVAIVGERFDGNDFAGAARDHGAAAVLVGRGRSDVAPRVEVEDTATALLALAAKRRAEVDVPVVAITGSTGKTSTKDLIAAGLPGSWSSPRSFNNEIGVPLTVLATPADATALVLEVGSRGRGHIASLAPAVRPDVSVVTNLGVVHLETFGTEQGLADAKYEIIEMLGPGGTAVVPDDEPRLRRGSAPNEITFGIDRGTVAVSGVVLDDRGYPSFRVDAPGHAVEVTLAVAGRHQALNAAAAIAVAIALDVDVPGFVAGMARATGSAWRMDVHRGRFTVVNDAYNANPQSVASALETVVRMGGRHTYAVLGPMAELGPVCEAAHTEMGRLARTLGVDALIVVGADHGYVLGAGDIVRNVTDSREAADTLRAIVEPGDVVLVKASRAAGLERLALALAEDAAP